MFTRRFVTCMKTLVVGIGAATAVSMGAIASLQIGFWLILNTWNPFPLSRIVELSGIDVPRRYFPAAIDNSEGSRPGTPDLVEWLLDLPAIVALFMALALFSVFYAALTSAEKGLATVSGVGDEPPPARGPR